MSKIELYPVVNPVGGDKIIITQVNGTPPDVTKNITVQSIIDLVPTDVKILPTKLLYGDAAGIGVDTDKLSYIQGGLGSVNEDTVVIDGTMSLTASSINDKDSLNIGSNIEQIHSNSIMYGQDINFTGIANPQNVTLVGKNIADIATGVTSMEALGQGLASNAGSILNTVMIGRNTGNNATGNFDGIIAIGHASLSNDLSICEDTIVLGDFTASGPKEIQDTIVIGRSCLQQAEEVLQSVVIGRDVFKDLNYSGGGGLIETRLNETVAIGYGVGAQIGDELVSENVFIGTFAMANSNQSTNVQNANQRNTVLGSRAALNLGLGNSPNGQPINDNVLIGYRAGWAGANNNVVAYEHNIYIGSDAGAEAEGVGNVGIGQNSNAASNLGFYNTAVGVNSLQSQTGGDFNVAIGNDALQQMTTATNNTAVGKAAGSTNVNFSNTTSVGHNSQPQANDEIVLGDNAVTTLRCNTPVISGLSDVRDKDNIEELSCGLDFIMDLEPVSWDWERRDGTMKGKKGSGFVAQEIDETVQEWEAEDILPSLVNKNNPDAWEVGNAALIPVLVKAIQELKAELDECKAGK